MIDLFAPILYFIAVFSFFEVFMFRNDIAYWQRPVTVTLYFLSAAVCAVVVFSSGPLILAFNIRWFEILLLAVFVVVLGVRVSRGDFAYGATPNVRDSLRYVVPKCADLFFQDILAVLVLTGMVLTWGAVWGTVAFGAYFVLVHLLLFAVLPFRFGIIFVAGSLAAGFVFASLIVYAESFWAVFVLHGLFYAFLYPRIRTLRALHYQT